MLLSKWWQRHRLSYAISEFFTGQKMIFVDIRKKRKNDITIELYLSKGPLLEISTSSYKSNINIIYNFW